MTRKRKRRKGGSVEVVIDLHGLTSDEAARRVLEAINRAVLDHKEKVSFVHGHGTGRVKESVHRTLRSLPLSLTFHVNPVNTGVTDVYL